MSRCRHDLPATATNTSPKYRVDADLCPRADLEADSYTISLHFNLALHRRDHREVTAAEFLIRGKSSQKGTTNGGRRESIGQTSSYIFTPQGSSLDISLGCVNLH